MVALANARVVAVLTRAPASGGKTRLFAALQQPHDPALLEALLLDTIDGIGASGIARIVAVDPEEAAADVRRLLPGDVDVIGQPPGSLGDRMRLVMTTLFAAGAASVVLVGSDLPELEPATVNRAFALIEAHPEDLVLGPATDGGYYLLGATHVPEVFDGIAWGTAGVLAETMAAAARAGLRVHVLDPLSDVDSPADLDRLAASGTTGARRTIAWIRSRGGAGGGEANS